MDKQMDGQTVHKLSISPLCLWQGITMISSERGMNPFTMAEPGIIAISCPYGQRPPSEVC